MTNEPRKIRDIVLSTRWSLEDAKTIFDEFEKSGLSATDFAGKLGIDVQRLYWWKRRLGRRSMRRAARGVFQELVVTEAVMPREDLRLEIVFPRGHSVRGPALFDEDTLRRVLKIVLESGAC